MPEQQYIYVMDPIPQQYEDTTRLYRFFDYLREGRFTTTQCNACGKLMWPPRVVCPYCLSDDLSYVDMPTTGRIYSYTVQVGGVPPGFPPPLVYALVDFDNGMRLFTAVVGAKPEEVAVGKEVELEIRDVAPDQQGRRRVLPFFRLK